MILISKTNRASLVWHGQLGCLINHWKGQVNEREYTVLMEYTMQFIQTHEVRGYVSDMSELEWIWEHAHDWDQEFFWSAMPAHHSPQFYGLVVPQFAGQDLLVNWIAKKLAAKANHVHFSIPIHLAAHSTASEVRSPFEARRATYA